MSSLFPPDEFDATIESAPVGVHRKPVSPWRSVLPFVVIVIAAPLLAWGAVWVVQNTGSTGSSYSDTTDETSSESESTDESADSTDSTDTTEETVSEEETTDETQTTDTTEEEEETEVIDYDATVRVLNNSGISGYAASSAEVLEQAGYTNVSADNASGWSTTVNTVYYASEDLAETAQDIADALGFSVVTMDTTSVGSGIVVLLATQ